MIEISDRDNAEYEKLTELLLEQTVEGEDALGGEASDVLKRIIAERDKYRQSLLDIDSVRGDDSLLDWNKSESIDSILTDALKDYYASPLGEKPTLPPYEG